MARTRSRLARNHSPTDARSVGHCGNAAAQHDSAQRGFSLLEVIIATAILAASTLLLLSLLTTGQRHADQARRRVLAQILCQSILDELIVDPAQLRTVANQPVDRYPDWTYSVDVTPTKIEGLVSLRISVAHVKGPQGPDDVRSAQSHAPFQLVRLARVPSGAGQEGASLTTGSTTSATFFPNPVPSVP